MKVVDLYHYRSQKAIRDLEEKVGRLALAAKVGSVMEIKTCFKEWLKLQRATR